MTDKRHFWQTEGLLIAGVTFFSYLCVYAYHFGYCKAFNIPTSLIDVNYIHVFGALLSIGFFLFITYYCVSDLRNWQHNESNVFRRYCGISSVFATSGYVIITFFFHKSSTLYVIYGIIMLFIIFWILALPLFTEQIGSDTKGFMNIWKKKVNKCHNRRVSNERIDWLQNTLELKFGISPNFVLLIFVVLIPGIAYKGNLDAKHEKYFFTISENEVILRQYNNYFVTAKFNPESKEIIGGVHVKPIIGKPTYEITKREVGPLKTPEKQKAKK